ncbi:MAG: efflux RND transporter permease subunit, partial [Elusimicrobia bacterium]|nr:efflux RND transporter permease subunit [Elusimicrobiota bacterium]
MNFIRTFVDRPVTTFMIYAIFCLMGVMALFRMPVDLMPGGDAGVLTIFVGIRGGLPPEDIESLVTKIVEDEMSTLAHLDNIVSVSRKERAVVTLNFKAGTDTSRASLEVQERLAKIRGKLPKEIEKPVVSRYDEGQSPVIILAMSSKSYTPEQMREIADNRLKPALKRANGVANIEVGGGREKKILVELDKNRLEAYALPIRQVVGQIGSDNLNILTGKVETSRDSYYVRTVGAYQTIDDIGNLPIAVTKEGSRLRLRDVAEIRDFYMEAESYSRLNREPVVSAYIQKETLANTITTAQEVKRVIDAFRKDLDPRITTQIVTDQSVAVEKALDNLKSSLYQGAFLVGSILLFFLRDFISTSFICLSIPLSLVMTLAAMSLFGLSLNIMTISGLAIASGQVVDTSICVLENILSHKTKFLRFLNRWDTRDASGSGNTIPSVYQSFVKLDKG